MAFKSPEKEREYQRRYKASMSPERREEYLRKGRESGNRHYHANKKKILESRKKFYLSNNGKEKARIFYAINGKTPKYRTHSYRACARKKGFCYDLSKEEFMSLWQKPCYYCGDAISTIGIDRVDSSIGYTISNVVPCCRFCNVGKLDVPQSEFIARAHRISQRHKIATRS